MSKKAEGSRDGWQIQALKVIRPNQIYNQSRQQRLVQRLTLALTPWSRLRGLLGSSPLTPEQGLLICPCNGIHTFFMGFAIDVLFLDRRGTVVGLAPEVRPWRVTRLYADAHCTLELAAGRIAATHTQLGDRLIYERIP